MIKNNIKKTILTFNELIRDNIINIKKSNHSMNYINQEIRNDKALFDELNKRKHLLKGLKHLPNSCQKLIFDYKEYFISAKGSTFKHQTWEGGYLDHLDEIFGTARIMYDAFNSKRALDFSLSDVYLVMFIHDIEKPFKHYDKDLDKHLIKTSNQDLLYKKLSNYPKELQNQINVDYQLNLNKSHYNALLCMHGEPESLYNKKERLAKPLAAFCHMCDIWSARGWYDEPLKSGYLNI